MHTGSPQDDPELRTERFEEFAHGLAFASLGLLESAVDAAEAIEDYPVFQKTLVRGGALYYDFCLSIHHRTAGFDVHTSNLREICRGRR